MLLRALSKVMLFALSAFVAIYIYFAFRLADRALPSALTRSKHGTVQGKPFSVVAEGRNKG